MAACHTYKDNMALFAESVLTGIGEKELSESDSNIASFLVHIKSCSSCRKAFLELRRGFRFENFFKGKEESPEATISQCYYYELEIPHYLAKRRAGKKKEELAGEFSFLLVHLQDCKECREIYLELSQVLLWHTREPFLVGTITSIKEE